jgi:hypothetical protein
MSFAAICGLNSGTVLMQQRANNFEVGTGRVARYIDLCLCRLVSLLTGSGLGSTSPSKEFDLLLRRQEAANVALRGCCCLYVQGSLHNRRSYLTRRSTGQCEPNQHQLRLP